MRTGLLLFVSLWLVAGCKITRPPAIPVSSDTVDPGGEVTFFGGRPHALAGNPVAVGDPLPPVTLLDSLTLEPVDLPGETGLVLVLSVVPAIDTAVCAKQTRLIAGRLASLPDGIRILTISRDTPADHKRFAEENKLTHMTFLSDHPDAPFGSATGLVVGELEFLARAMIVVDAEGMVHHLQVVPEIGHLPDLDAAFDAALELASTD
jgi:thiol peroxidase